ncbi:hypothetical protein ADEAN_000187300 [Angomonas deanei]|uniref:Uncharacterized protein n=1 Tax=Angomonas deanei TaxID=59799 RepID=A0A7G2C6J4_9TRYP|nr:hypothetical protein ADEAN_000187300 [Angomonas deanei]
MMRRATRTSAVTRSSVLVSGGRSLGSTRDKQRNQSGGDLSTGSQMQVVESPDLTPHLQFSMNALEHVRVPEISEERRRRSDIEKDREMRRKFGKDGPGERLTKSSPQTRKDMLEEQQDIDGLPWEVRWKKSLIPTTEEIVQDIRDRFDLYVQDPIEREQEWYLHWKDRGFKVQKDRMIWPQGYTDYLDHYDENGRRRVLPSDQRWTDSSWKHLADTNYKDRMWLIEGEERKAVHKSLQTQQALIEEEETRQMEMADVYHGLTSGVVDMDPDQAYQALSGTADPLEVAKTKMKIITYGAGEAGRRVPADPSEIDPISGFPRSDLPPLPTGVTVEQGAAIAAQAAMQNEIFEQKAETARLSGSDPTTAYMKAYHESSKKHGDKPGIRTQVEGSIEQVKQLQQQQERIERGNTTPNRPHVGDTMAQIETSLLQESVETPSKSGFIEIEKRPASAEPHIPQELYRVPQTESLSEMPEWYRETLVETQPLIKTYGMVHDPIEEQPAARVEYYQPTPLTEDDRALYADTAPDMVSAFDEVRVHKVKTLPELVEGYKPLPLFNEISKDGTLESGAEGEGGGGRATVRQGRKTAEKVRATTPGAVGEGAKGQGEVRPRHHAAVPSLGERLHRRPLPRG